MANIWLSQPYTARCDRIFSSVLKRLTCVRYEKTIGKACRPYAAAEVPLDLTKPCALMMMMMMIIVIIMGNSGGA